MTIGKSRLILSDSAISLGIRITKELPDLATRPLRSRPKSFLFFTSISISSITSWGRYSEPQSLHTFACLRPKLIPKNSTSVKLLFSFPPHLHLTPESLSDVKVPSPLRGRSSVGSSSGKHFHRTLLKSV